MLPKRRICQFPDSDNPVSQAQSDFKELVLTKQTFEA
jgi:hypothetical protein